MGLFTSFFSFREPEKPAGKQETFILVGSIKYERRITGDGQHQAALEAICGPRVQRGVHRFETAWLVAEEKNPRDKNARDNNGVRVEIKGRTVGYLSPQHAALFRQQLSARGMPNAIGQCQALITGGWTSSDGRKGNYEVSLDLPAAYR